ncbi:MAG: PadR family transcriptional regulator [Ilumatobacteraceae bacterium]
MTAPPRDPTLGEWTCLGILVTEPAHGWSIVKRLRVDGDLGRVWSLSRPLTYRALDQLVARAWIEAVGEEVGIGGPSRTILAATALGRRSFEQWVTTPVAHVRDLRSELLVKLVLAERAGIDVADMLARQRTIIDHHASALGEADPDDVVAVWRAEATAAARRFVDRITA